MEQDLTKAALDEYLVEVFEGYRQDPADSDYQRGYLAALLELAANLTDIPDVEDLDKQIRLA